jgi:hypothetical protein
MRFNGDTASDYSYTTLTGNGTTAASSRANSQTSALIANGITGLSATPTMFVVQVMNYSNSTTKKTFISRDTDSNGATGAIVGLWQPTTGSATQAITSITIFCVGDYTSGTISLYGIANSDIGAPKAFGGTITQDATYTYHTFGASGTFTPQQSLTADVLVIAGGGGGTAGLSAGGGGAGGLLVQSSRSIALGSYAVTIGAGGTGNNARNVQATSGSNTTFDGITANGGGGGGGGSNVGINGGSGGGGGSGFGVSAAGGTATQGNSSSATGYGFAGGTGNDSVSYYPAGGGGGAGGVGTSPANGNSPGTGGIGRTDSLINDMATATKTGEFSSPNYYYAGGGAGSDNGGVVRAGGLGGGGDSGITGTAAQNGATNTGGGAGGMNVTAGGAAAGGSGVVIIRYAN